MLAGCDDGGLLLGHNSGVGVIEQDPQYRLIRRYRGRKHDQLGKDLRKASKVLRPSEKPFFSPKAPSSKPWSAKPFIWSFLVHWSINLRICVSVCDSFFDQTQGIWKFVKMTAIPQPKRRVEISPMRLGLEAAPEPHHRYKAAGSYTKHRPYFFYNFSRSMFKGDKYVDTSRSLGECSLCTEGSEVPADLDKPMRNLMSTIIHRTKSSHAPRKIRKMKL